MTKQKKFITPSKFSKLIMFEMLYNFMLVSYYRSQARYDPEIQVTSIKGASSLKSGSGQKKKSDRIYGDELGAALGEIKKSTKKFWYFHMLWQTRYGNYLKNMAKRSHLAFVHEHVKEIVLRNY